MHCTTQDAGSATRLSHNPLRTSLRALHSASTSDEHAALRSANINSTDHFWSRSPHLKDPGDAKATTRAPKSAVYGDHTGPGLKRVRNGAVVTLSDDTSINLDSLGEFAQCTLSS
jgi:hypothetical protein